MKKQKMDLWLSDSLDGYESPIPIGGWKGLHQGRGKKKNKFLLRISAACLILFACLALWKFGSNPAGDQPGQTENRTAQKQAKSQEEIKTGSAIPPGENRLSVDEVPSKGSGVQLVSRQENLPLNPLPAEIQRVSKLQPLSIGNNAVAPVRYVPKEGTIQPLKEKYPSRFPGRMSFFIEAGLSAGNLVFADDANLAQYRSFYSTCIKSQDLRQIERKIGFVVYYQGLRRWSVGSGLALSHNTASGRVDYAYYESGFIPSYLGSQGWPESTLDQAENLSHPTTIRSWNLHVPLRFRYQPFAYYGPFMEIGAMYSYNLSNQGDWLDPETLKVVQSRNLVAKHLFSAELSVGYQWKFSRTCVSLQYRFSPWSTKYSPIQGRMGASLHGIHLQMQLPH